MTDDKGKEPTPIRSTDKAGLSPEDAVRAEELMAHVRSLDWAGTLLRSLARPSTTGALLATINQEVKSEEPSHYTAPQLEELRAIRALLERVVVLLEADREGN